MKKTSDNLIRTYGGCFFIKSKQIKSKLFIIYIPTPQLHSDPFEKACSVIGSSIGGDWPVLYRKLPFYPPRGTATIDNDVEVIA